MIVEDLDEAVSVRADFSGGEVIPRAFCRSGRTYMVTSVNGRWLDREAGMPRYYFSIQANDETYFLSLHTEDMTWRVEKVILEG